MNIKACLTHKTDNWQSPKYIYEHFMKRGYIDLFPYKANYDQFKIDYYKEKLFCNPPFSKLKDVIPYLIKQAENGCEVMLLMPSRTDTKYFHELLNYGHITIYFIKGRLHYNESKSAPFPSMIVYINKKIGLPLFTKFWLEENKKTQI